MQDKHRLLRIVNIEYALIQGLYWIGFCGIVSYAAVYLQASGYSNTQLGRILAAGYILGFLFPQMLANLIDRYEKITVYRSFRCCAMPYFLRIKMILSPILRENDWELSKMKLVIHDFDAEEWEQIRADYEGDRIVSDLGTIRPCVGCFCCWNKTPGRCVIRDGYENMGELIHRADEVVVFSRYTYGGFSGFVKNVFDRCLGYVLPQFEVIDGETHHQKRYPEDKPYTFIFRGHALSGEEQESARRYVKAVCANIRGHVKAVEFRECEEQPCSGEVQNGLVPDRIVFLNGSMRSQNGNSAKLAGKLGCLLQCEYETVELRKYIADLPGLLAALETAETLIFCTPLYVDGLPAQLIRFLEYAQGHADWAGKKVYVLANMGLYESKQLVNLFSAVRQWCGTMNMDYCGGLGVSAGELVGVLISCTPFRLWPTGKIAAGMGKLAEAVRLGAKTEDIYTEPFGFPRSLYIRIANTNWNRTAKQNGISPADLYRRLS